MWELVGGIILVIGLVSSAEQVNVTKEEKSLIKRYIIIPQYNSLLYTNSQVVPTQQFIFGPTQTFPNYINSFEDRTPYGTTPSYYILPQNNYLDAYPVQNIVPQIQNTIIPTVPPPQVPPQQVVPQQVPPSQIVPRILPQQVVPQQVQNYIPPYQPQRIPAPVPQIRNNIIAQLPQQVQNNIPAYQPQRIPTPVPQIRNNIVTPLQQQVQNNLPAYQPQRILAPVPQVQSNILTPLPQQVVPYPFARDTRIPLQYQQYQPPYRNQVVVGNEPYPYEVPPGQNKLPVTPTKQIPNYVRPQVPQVYSYPVTQNLAYNFNTPHRFSPPHNSQPQTVYVDPNLQAPGVQQVVRIGYGQPAIQQHLIQTSQPHTVYLHPSGGAQQVVRIGYGHQQLNQDEVFQGQEDIGPQRIRLGLPLTYNVVPSQQNGGGQADGRATRTPSADEAKLEQKEAVVTKS